MTFYWTWCFLFACFDYSLTICCLRYIGSFRYVCSISNTIRVPVQMCTKANGYWIHTRWVFSNGSNRGVFHVFLFSFSVAGCCVSNGHDFVAFVRDLCMCERTVCIICMCFHLQMLLWGCFRFNFHEPTTLLRRIYDDHDKIAVDTSICTEFTLAVNELIAFCAPLHRLRHVSVRERDRKYTVYIAFIYRAAPNIKNSP